MVKVVINLWVTYCYSAMCSYGESDYNFGSPIATVLCAAMVKVVINLWVTYCCSTV